jgi:hypothetical protein
MPQPTMTREAEVLLASLNHQRDHVLGILDGLSDEAMHRPVLPSGWTCLGLVQHLALDVERFWFRGVFAGEVSVEPIGLDDAGPDDAGPDDAGPDDAGPDDAGPDAWQVGAEVPAEDVLNLYRQEIELANAIIATTPLDSPPVQWPQRWPSWRFEDLRQAILHVITESACHAGHLDAVRELIDGRTWMVIG